MSTVCTADGGSATTSDVQVGDRVIGANGRPTTVVATRPRGRQTIYRVTMKDGASAECDGDQLWAVYDAQRARKYRVLTVHELLAIDLRRTANNRLRFSMPRTAPVEYPEQDNLPVDPYALGAWLGDGSIRKHVDGTRTGVPTLATYEADEFIANEVRRRLMPGVVLRLSARGYDGQYTFRPATPFGYNPFQEALIALGVNRYSVERFIPERYQRGSVRQRLDLLRGLMDTDGEGKSGNRIGNHSRLYTRSKQLAHDTQRLVRSLGGTASLRTHYDAYYRIEMQTEACPFLLPRKAARWARGDRHSTNRIVSIELVGARRHVRHLTVDATDGLFLTDGYIVTRGGPLTSVPAATREEMLDRRPRRRTTVPTPR